MLKLKWPDLLWIQCTKSVQQVHDKCTKKHYNQTSGIALICTHSDECKPDACADSGCIIYGSAKMKQVSN